LTSSGSNGPAICLGCGCACDDIDVQVAGNRIVQARHACSLGVAWFGDGVVPARVRLSGRDAALDEGLDAAARLLAQAMRPLIYLAPDVSCETQREAIALADAVRATVDSVTSSTAVTSLLAAQEMGRAGSTLGEIRNRADVLVFWGVDPSIRYPRYWSRYAPEPAGIHVADGRRSRTVVAVDVGDASGPADADVRMAISMDDEVATLTELRALVANPDVDRLNTLSRPVPGSDPGTTNNLGQAPIPASILLPVLLRGRYVVFVADAEPDEANATRDPGRAAALIALTQAVNGRTRCALSTLRGGGNRSGADSCMTSQTGYPVAVDFARGYPRYRPYDGAAARLARGDVDALLVIGASSLIPAEVATMAARVTCAVIGPRASDGPLAGAQCVIDTGVAGIHESGTAIRMDEVPLPLRTVVTGALQAFDTTRALRARIRPRKKE
jgi:formylmethanofuran dehydrogenase subunit B